MKKLFRVIFYCITLMLICQPLPTVAKSIGTDVNDFYFEDFTADYYVTKDSDGVSHMKVIEEMTAVFPDYEQNKGIVRKIPFTNQAGKNIVMKDLTEAEIKVTRNGIPEPIYSLERNDDYYEVSTGTNDYVTGKQVYRFEYTFDKVVTDFGSYQEIYWDTNGTGWSQKFNNLTARVHFDEDTSVAFTGNSWCYVGKYGQSGSERCEINKLADGVEFTTSNLESHENLTFDTELNAGSFTIPESDGSYGPLIIVSTIMGILVVVLLRGSFKEWPKIRKNKRFYKSLFVKPEYQPNSHYRLSELGTISLERRGELKVAMLLDLAVRKKVEIIEREGTGTRKKWGVKIIQLTDLTEEEMDILKRLNGKDLELKEGVLIKIQKQSANRELQKLDKAFYKAIDEKLKQNGLVEENFKSKEASKVKKWNKTEYIIYGVLYFPVMAVFIFAITSFGVNVIVDLWENICGGIALLQNEMRWGTFIITSVIMLIREEILERDRIRFGQLTENGLRIAREMDGLCLYIKMAEKDRIKFLQSIEGADTSPEGIVKLYEKLLPYAVIFGLEKSWLAELQKYCEAENITIPSTLGAGIGIQDLTAFSTSTSSSFASSSGSSGGGGGGFSGGGGGGGGGGGR